MRESWTPSSLKWLAQRMGERLVSLADIRPSRLFKVMVKYYILGAMESDCLMQTVTKTSYEYKMREREIPSRFPNALSPKAQPFPQGESWNSAEPSLLLSGWGTWGLEWENSLREHRKLVTRAEQEPELLIVQSWIEIPGPRITDSNPSSVT